MSASIELNFHYNEKHIDKYQFSFQGEKQEIKSDLVTINIPESVFKYGKDKSPIKLTLFEKNSSEKNEYDFNVYYSENTAYVDLNGLNSKTYEIIFKNIENLTISGNGIKFTKLDDVKNKNKKRLVLINWDSTCLKVNKKLINLMDIISIHYGKVHSSFQLSEIDYKENKFIVKPIEKKEEDNLSLLINNKDKYESFVNKLNDLEYLDNKDCYEEKLINLINEYNDVPKINFIYFNTTTEYLDEIIDKQENYYLHIFFNYFIYLFFYGNIDIYLKSKAIPFCFINIIKDKFNEIKEQKQINTIEKIRALNALFLPIRKFKSMEELNKLDIKIYYNTKENLNKNSILGKVVNFLNNYIKGINEKSAVYEYLLDLYGDYGYYNKEKVYSYDLTNLSMVKMHLNKLIPKILIFCNIQSNEIILASPEFNGIVINEYYLLSKYSDEIRNLKIDYNKSVDYIIKDLKITEDSMNDIAMDIALGLIYDFYKKDKFEYILAYKLLFDIKGKGKLILRPELFTDNGEILKNYINLRTIIKQRNLIFLNNINSSIEEDIASMNNLITNSENSEDNEILKGNKNLFLNKKRYNELEKSEQYEKDEKDNDEDELPFLERIKNKSRVQILEECRKRVFKRFKFKLDENLRYNMIQKLKQLNKNDSYYHDLIFLIEDSRRIV